MRASLLLKEIDIDDAYRILELMSGANSLVLRQTVLGLQRLEFKSMIVIFLKSTTLSLHSDFARYLTVSKAILLLLIKSLINNQPFRNVMVNSFNLNNHTTGFH